MALSLRTYSKCFLRKLFHFSLVDTFKMEFQSQKIKISRSCYSWVLLKRRAKIQTTERNWSFAKIVSFFTGWHFKSGMSKPKMSKVRLSSRATSTSRRFGLLSSKNDKDVIDGNHSSIFHFHNRFAWRPQHQIHCKWLHNKKSKRLRLSLNRGKNSNFPALSFACYLLFFEL